MHCAALAPGHGDPGSDLSPATVCPLSLASRAAGLAALAAPRHGGGGTATCCGLEPPRIAAGLQVNPMTCGLTLTGIALVRGVQIRGATLTAAAPQRCEMAAAAIVDAARSGGD
jgi:hypothetical protein